MPQSLSCLLAHLIFSTKERHPFLAQNELMLRTHAYLGGILREASCPSLVVGGTADHVHVFFHLPRTQHVAKMVETLKSHSSRWIKAQGIEKLLAARVWLFFGGAIAGPSTHSIHRKSSGSPSQAHFSGRVSAVP